MMILSPPLTNRGCPAPRFALACLLACTGVAPSMAQETHRHQVDFRRVMERVSGEPLQWFFDQWLRRGGALFVDWSHRYDADRGTLTVELFQTQTEDPFRTRVPITVRFRGDNGVVQRHEDVVWLDRRKQSFEFKLPTSPMSVELDENVQVLIRTRGPSDQPPG